MASHWLPSSFLSTTPLACIVIGSWFAYWVFGQLTSPLNTFPSVHWSARFSRLYLLWIRGSGKEFSTYLEAHRRLGPMLRIGPNEVSIAGLDEVRTVYGGNWDKGKMYGLFRNFGYHPLFGIKQKKEHLERKRIYTSIYSKSTLSKSSELHDVINVMTHEKLRPTLQELARKGTVINSFPLASAYSMDLVTSYIFGSKHGTSWLGNSEEASPYQSAFVDVLEHWTWFASTEAPKLVDFLSRIGVNLIPASIPASWKTCQSWALGLTERSISSLKTNSTPALAFQEIWRRLQDYSVPESEQSLLLASDLMDQLHAGHEAPAIVLTYLLWRLSNNQIVQERLRNDLVRLRDSGQSMEDSEILENVLIETLRLHPATYGPLPRIAPRGGNLAGVIIPEGTEIIASSHILGQNQEVFPDPESWHPERWDKGEEEKRRMKRWVWAFGSGNRVCIGEHLAILTMKSFVAEIYSSFKTVIGAESDMRQQESLFATPVEALYLRFEQI